MASAKLDSLTGLRFIAAAAIVTQHSTILQIPIPHYQYDRAVSFFFVLSGFILTYVHPRLAGAAQIRAFYFTRLGRIWPAHLASLFLVAMLLNGITFNAVFLANFFMLQSLVPMMPFYFSYSAPSWSVSVELVFYLLFPLLIFRWSETWWWKLIGAATLVVAIMFVCSALSLPNLAADYQVTAHGLLYIDPFARLLEFVVGIGTCSVFLWIRPRLGWLSTLAFTVAEIAAALLVITSVVWAPEVRLVRAFFGDGIWMQWLDHAGGLWVFPFLIAVFGLGRGAISKLCSVPAMLILGEMSFSIYLIHQTIFRFYVLRWPAPTDATARYGGLAACIVLILIMAYLLWRFVEMPIRNLVKTWVRASKPDLQVEPVRAT